MKTDQIHDAEDHITQAAVDSSATNVLPSDSVLLVVRSGILEHTLPVALTRVPVALNQDLKAITPHRGIHAPYLALALRGAGGEILRACAKSGTTVASLEFPALLAFPVAIAPQKEQHRIVEEVEKQFTRLDAAVAGLQRVKANLKRYRASALKAACEGRLVPTEAELARREGRSFETGEELLKQILKERRASWEANELPKTKAAGKAAVSYALSADRSHAASRSEGTLRDLPIGWAWTSLGQVARIQGGIQKQPSRAPRKNHYPFLRVANVARGSLDLSDIHRVELFPGELEKLRLEQDDLLIVEGNGSQSEIGRLARWNGSIRDCVHQNHIIRARLVPGVLPGFVESYWNSPEGASRLLAVASSTSGLYTLSVSKVSGIPVPLPPLPEQRRIVAEVERRLSVIDELEATIEKNLARCARLRQSILKMAFEGRLVPQDPNDEPASVLLERIRSTRAAGTVSSTSPSSSGLRIRRRAKKP